jgi:hypothetical protein
MHNILGLDALVGLDLVLFINLEALLQGKEDGNQINTHH